MASLERELRADQYVKPRWRCHTLSPLPTPATPLAATDAGALPSRARANFATCRVGRPGTPDLAWLVLLLKPHPPSTTVHALPSNNACKLTVQRTCLLKLASAFSLDETDKVGLPGNSSTQAAGQPVSRKRWTGSAGQELPSAARLWLFPKPASREISQGMPDTPHTGACGWKQ